MPIFLSSLYGFAPLSTRMVGASSDKPGIWSKGERSFDPSGGAPLGILVVEDEALVLMSLVDMLGELGHDVLEAGNAATALSFLNADAPVSLMLTDVNLPDMKGPTLAEQARALRPSLPIVFCTGYRMDVPEELARSGPTGVLSKPYWLGELEKALLLAG